MQILTTPISHNGEDATNTTERAAVFLDSQYNDIVDGMFAFNDGRQTRRMAAFMGVLRETLVHIEYPTTDDVWSTSKQAYTQSTKQQNERWLKRGGWLDGDRFGARFWNEYQRRWALNTEAKKRLSELKNDSQMRHEYDIERRFDIENTMDVIRANPHVIYNLKEMMPAKLDYFDTHNIQIIEMNHVGVNPVVQLPLSYHYRCAKCQAEGDEAFDVKSVPCFSCEDGRMSRVPSLDVVRPAYASQVMTSDRNTIPIISITEIPPGGFIGAVFLCRSKTDYYLFMIASEAITPVSGTINVDEKDHAVWQIIDMIDGIHDDLIGKHIHGMDWYKAAILFAYLDNRRGHASTNLLVVGGAGLAKTSTARLYLATITAQQKLQPVVDLTGPGLRGSTTHVTIGQNTVPVHESGLLSRYYMVILDELLGSNNPVLPALKSTMISSTLSVEVANNRSTIPKTATAIATSNRISAVEREQGKWMLKWIEAADEDPTNEFSRSTAQEAMEAEWRDRGVEWFTGLPFADIDRYSLIFFPFSNDDKITVKDIDGADEEIDDLTLSKMLYNPNIDEYFNFMGKIVVDWKRDAQKIVDFAESVRRYDEIHSKTRFGNRITRMLILSAQINGRSEIIDQDYDFVRELWSKTGTRIHIRDLSRDATNTPTKTYAAPVWSTERIKQRIRKYLGDTLFSVRGEMMIIDTLENEGADPNAVKFVIEKYKQNPNQ